MKREFEMSSSLFCGDDQAFAVDDEAYIINGMHDKLSFRALLSLCLNHEEQTALLHLLPPQLMTTAATSNFNCLPYDVYPPMPLPLPENVAFVSLTAFPPTTSIRSLQCGGGDLELKFSKMPRPHQFGSYGYGYGYNNNNSAAISTEPSNFFADVSCDYGFRHLPDLRSLEKQQQPLPLNTDFGFRPPRNIGGYILEKSTGNYQPPPTRRQPHREPRKAAKTESRSCKLARERRQKQCEKIRYLQKLMPWDTKMDTARMLEEAHKYVKFLQAQVKVLQNMPARGALPSPNTIPTLHGGPLASLSRQQLLEVLVNSPAAQTFLYSRGCCVYSVEQLALLGNVVDRKALFEQMLIASASMLRS